MADPKWMEYKQAESNGWLAQRQGVTTQTMGQIKGSRTFTTTKAQIRQKRRERAIRKISSRW